MKLTEAREFVLSTRPQWRDADNNVAKINSQHVVDVLGDINIEDITPMDYVRIQNHFRALGKSNGTVNRITSALSTIFSELVKHHLIDKVVRCPNPLKEPKGRVTYYTDDEVLAMREACHKLEEPDAMLVKDIILFASHTGARQGEILKLTWRNVDFEMDLVCFRRTKDGSDRDVPMTSAVKEMLTRLHDERIDEAEVFPIHKDRLLRRIRKLKRLCNITDEEKCFHTFRHGVATKLLARGAAVNEAMALLGHSQISTTMRYAHATAEGKRNAVSRLED